jgi:hypothetical protein
MSARPGKEPGRFYVWGGDRSAGGQQGMSRCFGEQRQGEVPHEQEPLERAAAP